MPTPKCYVCQKTAYPLESYSAADNTFHKLCFRCKLFVNEFYGSAVLTLPLGKECKMTLNVGTFKAFEGSVYCAKCVPKPSATAVADDFKVKNALSKFSLFCERIHICLTNNSYSARRPQEDR